MMFAIRRARVTDDAAIPHDKGDAPRPRARTARRSLGREATALQLVFGVVALVLGLVMVMASLRSFADAPREVMHASRYVDTDRAVASPGQPRFTSPAPPQLLAMVRDPVEPFAATARPHSITTGPAISPLYPQNGVTLWDRIRVSAKRDRRAFLLGTAIQIHDPATAATPGTRSMSPPCCPLTSASPREIIPQRKAVASGRPLKITCSSAEQTQCRQPP